MADMADSPDMSGAVAGRSRLGESLALIRARFWTLVAATLLVYLPYYCAYKWTIELGWPDEAADRLFGLIGLLASPLASGMVMALLAAEADGRALDLGGSIRAATQAWTRLLTVYISMGLVVAGWLVIVIGPCFILLSLFGVDFAHATNLNAIAAGGAARAALLVAAAALVAGVVATVMARYPFVDPLVVLAGKRPWEARHRSAELAKGRRLRIIGMAILLYGPAAALEEGADLVCDRLRDTIGLGAVGVDIVLSLVAALLYIVPAAYFYVWYRELAPANAPRREEST